MPAKRMLVAFGLCAWALALNAREVAITIDDLPRGGDGGSVSLVDVRAMTRQLLTPFQQQKIPVTGFVNAGRLPGLGDDGLRQILELWLDAGADLGNHSYSHPDLNEVALSVYVDDVLKGEPELRRALSAHGKNLRYFRHPYLHTGATRKTQQALRRFLDQRGYRVAPVTFDNADYEFAALYTRAAYKERVALEYVPYMESVVSFFEHRSVDVLGRAIPQILLIHANQMNADLMPDLLAMLRRRGYSFISLEQALADRAYSQPDDDVESNGISWLHRWAATKGLAPKSEPDPPQWVVQASANL